MPVYLRQKQFKKKKKKKKNKGIRKTVQMGHVSPQPAFGYFILISIDFLAPAGANPFFFFFRSGKSPT
jgi:hypothetical protein